MQEGRQVDPCAVGTCKCQRRSWMCSVQLAHMGLDETATESEATTALGELWKATESDPRVRYACGQLERGEETGRLHGQMYLEFNVSVRNTQVRKVMPSWATHMKTTRTKCRDYCRKAESRIAAMPELGEWRSEELKEQQAGPKARALQMLIQEGMTPAEIAVEDPEAFFTFHAAINATWKALEGHRPL